MKLAHCSLTRPFKMRICVAFFLNHLPQTSFLSICIFCNLMCIQMYCVTLCCSVNLFQSEKVDPLKYFNCDCSGFLLENIREHTVCSGFLLVFSRVVYHLLSASISSSVFWAALLRGKATQTLEVALKSFHDGLETAFVIRYFCIRNNTHFSEPFM